MAYRKFTQEFKQEAVKLALEGKVSKAQVARELGIRDNIRYRWIDKYGSKENKQTVLSVSEKAELVRLRREIRRIKQERDILKKAISIFSKEPDENTGL